MAIWQFSLVVIPKKAIMEKFGLIPETLVIRYDRFEKLPKNSDELVGFEILAKDLWISTDILPIEIIHQIDKIVNRANWGNSDIWTTWKTYSNEKGKELDNDAHLSINLETGKIEQLSFRADLREPQWLFLTNMIELAKLYDWVFLDRKGNITEADKSEVRKLVVQSNPYKFLQNPDQFCADLESGKIKPE